MLRKAGQRKAVPTWGTAITRGSQTRSEREDPGGGKVMVAVDPRAARTWERRLQGAPAVRGWPWRRSPSPTLRAPQKRSGWARDLVLGSRLSPQPAAGRRVRRPAPPRPERRCRARLHRAGAGPGAARSSSSSATRWERCAGRRGARRDWGFALDPRGDRPGHGLVDCGPVLRAPALGEVRPTSAGIRSSPTTGPGETGAPAPATPGRLQVPRRRPARPARP